MQNRYLKSNFANTEIRGFVSIFRNFIRETFWDIPCFLTLKYIYWELVMLERYESLFWNPYLKDFHRRVLKSFKYQFEKMAWHPYQQKVKHIHKNICSSRLVILIFGWMKFSGMDRFNVFRNRLVPKILRCSTTTKMFFVCFVNYLKTNYTFR